MQITGIILSGGKSIRMGTDKALLKLGDKSLIETAIDICKPVCTSIIISSNNPEHGKFGYPVIADDLQDCGPIGGIYSSLKHSETEWNFVISVDAPFVTTPFIRYLISEIGGSTAVIPFHDKGMEPLIGLYHKNSLPEIEKMLKSGIYKMVHLINALDTKLVNAQNCIEKYPDLFRNLNSPEDFNKREQNNYDLSL